MKPIKELKFEDLSLEQKFGMSTILYIWSANPEQVDYLEQRIRDHALGGLWVVPREGQNDATLKRLKDAADYPLLIFTDAESGFGEYTIGSILTR